MADRKYNAGDIYRIYFTADIDNKITGNIIEVQINTGIANTNQEYEVTIIDVIDADFTDREKKRWKMGNTTLITEGEFRAGFLVSEADTQYVPSGIVDEEDSDFLYDVKGFIKWLFNF